MKKRSVQVTNFSLALLILCLFLGTAQAASVVSPNWNLNDINSQIRQPTVNYSGTSAVIGGASLTGGASNNILTVNGLTLSTEDDLQTSYDNGTDVVIGGAVYHNTANANRVNILNNATIQGRTVIGGAALLNDVDHRLDFGAANNNYVFIQNSDIINSTGTVITGYIWDDVNQVFVPVLEPIGGNVIGGITNYTHAQANNNTVYLENSNVDRNVYGTVVQYSLLGGVDYDLEDGHLLVDIQLSANNNKVYLKDSHVTGDVIGSYGGDSISNGLIQLDNSTASNVLGTRNNMTYYRSSSSSDSATSTFSNNRVEILNGSVIDSAETVSGYSSNATGNSLLVNNSTVSNGLLHTVAMSLGTYGKDQTPINAALNSNSLDLQNISGGTIYEIGAGLNYSGIANEHTTTLKNVTGVTVSRQAEVFSTRYWDASTQTWTYSGLTWNDLVSKDLLALRDGGYWQDADENIHYFVTSQDNFKPTYGFIYGAVALDYTQDDSGGEDEPEVIANGGYEANGNIVSISGSTVNANVIGGFAGQFQEIDYSDGGQTVHKVGNDIITTDSSGTTREAVTDMEDKTFSASNNIVTLENTNFDGVVYGGFVAAADVKIDNVSTSNNTVIVKGNTTLSATSTLYGGNAYLGRTTNTLLFDHVAGTGGTYITFANHNQFQNFNDTWQINADLDTRINFNFNGVQAQVNVDRNNLPEGTATIIKTQTTSDLTDIDQNGVITDLLDSSVELAHSKSGIYSYTLTPQKDNATTIGWVLGVTRDHNNAEVYGQMPIVGLALAAEGPELLENTIREAWQSDVDSEAFVSGGYHHTRYHTGSGFDLNSGLMQAGFWRKVAGDLLGGIFVKYSAGSYKTYPIDASGDASAFGGGLMASIRYSESGRFEASAEIGQLDMEFESSELLSKMKSRGMYYGASFGIVQDLTSSFDLFANLRYLRKGDDDMTDNLGQAIHYHAMQSLTLHAGTNIEFSNIEWGGLVPSIGLSGIYEFDGKSKVGVMGVSNNEASLQGLSGRGDFILTYESEETLLPLVSKLILFGQAGKRTGFGGEINLSFQF